MLQFAYPACSGAAFLIKYLLEEQHPALRYRHRNRSHFRTKAVCLSGGGAACDSAPMTLPPDSDRVGTGREEALSALGSH